MRIATHGETVYYAGSVQRLHGPARVVTAGACWCIACNGRLRLRLVSELPGAAAGRDILHVRPRSVRLLLPLVD